MSRTGPAAQRGRFVAARVCACCVYAVAGEGTQQCVLLQKFKELGQASVGRRGVVWMNGDVGRDFYSEVAVAVGGMGELKSHFINEAALTIF